MENALMELILYWYGNNVMANSKIACPPLVNRKRK